MATTDWVPMADLDLGQKLEVLRETAIAFGWRVVIRTPRYLTSNPAWSVSLVPVHSKKLELAAVSANQGEKQTLEDVVDEVLQQFRNRLEGLDKAVNKIVKESD